MKPKNLTTFFNELSTKGIRKQNQFQIVISSGHSDIDKSFENITMWASTAQLPGRTQEFTEVTYQGYPFQLPSRMIMDNEMSMTLKLSSTGDERRALLKWASYISNPAISDGSAGEGDKKLPANSHIRLLMFDDAMDKENEVIRLVGAIPMTIGSVDLSNESADVSTCDITFKFQYWEIESADGDHGQIR